MSVGDEMANKSDDASEWWNSIGSLARRIYLNMVITKPDEFKDSKWEDIPRPIRSWLSEQMNRLQGRRNKTKIPGSPSQNVVWGKRKYPIRPHDMITKRAWSMVYLHKDTHPTCQFFQNAHLTNVGDG
jgi:aspartyl/asparaginyl beta-hydroxylase (cupin superfamily)